VQIAKKSCHFTKKSLFKKITFQINKWALRRHHGHKRRPKSLLSQLCDSVRLPSGLTPFNLAQDPPEHGQLHLRQLHERAHSPSLHGGRRVAASGRDREENSYFSSYFNDEYFSLDLDSLDTPRYKDG
jgi:hypothetical protein